MTRTGVRQPGRHGDPERAVRLARRFTAWARVPVWFVRHRRAAGMIVLMYHRVGGGTPLELDLPVDLFTRQLTYLRRRYRIVSLDDLPQFRRGGAAPGADVVVLTFDDAHAEMFDLLPVLLRHKVPVTMYVPTAYVEGRRRFDWGRYSGLPEASRPAPMTWDQVSALRESGLVTVGAHGHTHVDLSQAPPDLVREEIERSDELFHQRLGLRVRHFAYPFGRRAQAGHSLVAGRYETVALSGSVKNAYAELEPRNLRRVPVSQGDGFWLFRLRLATLDTAGPD